MDWTDDGTFHLLDLNSTPRPRRERDTISYTLLVAIVTNNFSSTIDPFGIIPCEWGASYEEDIRPNPPRITEINAYTPMNIRESMKIVCVCESARCNNVAHFVVVDMRNETYYRVGEGQ